MRLRLADTVWVLNVGADTDGDDGHGNPDPSWDDAAALAEPALVQPVSSTENNAAEDTIISRWRIFLLPVTSATAASRVRWAGDLFEVDGEVQPFPDLRGRVDHHEAFLRRVSDAGTA